MENVIGAIFQIKDGASGSIKNIVGASKNAESALLSSGNKVSGFISKTVLGSVLGLSGGIVGMATLGVKSALDLQSNMNKFKSATGATTAETDKVKASVKTMYVATGKSYSDLTDMAITMHQQLGMGANDISKYGTGWVKFAKVTGQSNNEAITGIAGIRNSWGLTNTQIQPVLDQLILSNQKYGLSVTDSEESLKKLAPAFNAAKMPISQGIAYLDLFKKSGLDSSNATIAFNTALKKVKNPTELKKMITDISNTKGASERANKAVALFGKQGLSMANALKPGSVGIKDIEKALNSATGATSKASAALANGNITASLAKIKRTSLDLLENVGEKALPTIQKMVTFISGHMPQIQATMSSAFNVAGKAASLLGTGISYVTSHSNILIPVVAGLAAGLGALKVVNTVNGLMKKWEASTVAQTFAEGGLNAVMEANPIGVVILIIGALVAAGVALYMHWGTVKKYAQDLWTSLSSTFGNIKKDVVQAWTDITSFLAHPLTGVINIAKNITGNGGAAATKVNGSHANGLDYVPFDGYIAQLHKGERVQTAAENPLNKKVKTTSSKKSSIKSQNSSGQPFVINIYGMTIREEADIDKVASALVKKLDDAATNAA